MNKDQIKNGEVRCFPFYKGEYMGDLPFGYSNEQSAKKFMKNIPDKDVYERLGGKDEYMKTHMFVRKLDKSKLYVFNPPRHKLNYTLSDRKVEGIYDYSGEKVFLKDLDPKLAEEIIEDLKDIGCWPSEYELKDKVKAFQEKYDLFPCGSPYNITSIDDEDFRKMRSKMMKEDVEYRKGIVHINIEYVD